jgi:hypothetical protein
MAESDWTSLADALDTATVARGVTSGATPPSGGGTFVYGANSLVLADGGFGLYYNAVDFAPMAKGGSVRGAVQRGVSGGKTNFSPFLFLCLQGNSVNDEGYLLGLSDEDPHKVSLVKGVLASGIPSASPGDLGVLRKSTGTFSAGTWLHLRLDAVVNTNGDVILKCYRNTASVASPTWEAIPGMTDFTDDSLSINTGSAPFTSGYAGFGGHVADVTRRMYWDQIEVHRQL